jgi:hypothetical protein
MNTRGIRILYNFVVIAVLATMPVFDGLATGQESTSVSREAAVLAKQRIERLRQVAKTLHGLTDQAPPVNLSASERDEAKRYYLWLIESSRRLGELADRWQAALVKGTQTETTRQNMQEMSQSFNLQYLDLQQNMQQENRQFTLVSNIMKNKHDTAKNSINNIR